MRPSRRIFDREHLGLAGGRSWGASILLPTTSGSSGTFPCIPPLGEPRTMLLLLCPELVESLLGLREETGSMIRDGLLQLGFPLLQLFLVLLQ